MLTALAPFVGDTILPIEAARTHLNLTADESYHDDAVRAARDAAIAWAESYTWHSFQERQFLWTADRFTNAIRLPRGPIASVDGISYYDGDGTDTVLTDWYLGGDRLTAAAGASWPVANGLPGGVRVTFTAGYAAAGDIPFNLLASMKLAMTAFFEDRSNPDLSAAMGLGDQFRPVSL